MVKPLKSLKRKTKRFINRKKRGRLEEDIIALSDFIEGACSNGPFDYRQIRRNLENGVVEIIDPSGEHSSNGLLITDNGYFLTANHCVNGGSNQKRIKLDNGKAYRVERVCAVGKRYDIALAKATIPEEARARNYRFFNGDPMLQGVPTILVTRWEGKIERSQGRVNNIKVTSMDSQTRKIYINQFEVSCVGVHGDSGGIVATRPNAKIMGFASAKTQDDLYTRASKSDKAIELVNFYIQNLMKRAEEFS